MERPQDNLMEDSMIDEAPLSVVPLRSTYAFVDNFQHRLKATAALLSISENTLRTTLSESGIEVRRANETNPTAPAIRIFDLPTIFKIAEWRRNKKLTKTAEGKKPIIIAVEIIKGGTAKSTTAAEVGVQLQLLGLKVAAFDLDIQSNLSQLLGYEADLSAEEAEANGLTQEAIVHGTFATICAPFIDREAPTVDARTIIKYPFGPSGPALIPSDTYFGDLERTIEKSRGPRELTFKRFFEASARGEVPGLNAADFDVLILDCPPSISMISTNAIAAADIIVAPVRMESFAVKGLSRLVSEMNALGKAYKGHIKIGEMLVLPTFFSTSVGRTGRMYDKLKMYRENLSPISISTSEEFPKSIELYLPLTLTKPTCNAVKEYRLFVDHLVKMMQAIAKSKDQSDIAAA